MHRMRIARFGSCTCTRTSGASRDLYGQRRRRSQCTVTTAPEHPQRGSWSGPQPGVSCHSSLCNAHRGVSTCLRGSGSTARSSSGPAEEDAREAVPESTPTSATHVNQNEGSAKTSWRGRRHRVRRDLGLTNVKSCLATANVRTLHPKEESESRWRFGGTLMLGKVELLEIAMRDAEIDVVGLQESRSRQAGIFNGPLFRRYCGAADGNGQLWIAASWNFTMLTMDDISPRLLVVIGRRAGCGTLLNFVVAHAPCEHASHEENTTFLDALQCCDEKAQNRQGFPQDCLHSRKRADER